MSSTITLTWAIPVEAHLLGASMEAYVESKAAISMLRLCAQNGNPSEAPIARLPPEMVEEIVGHAQLPFYEKRFQDWVDITNCLDGWCRVFNLKIHYDEDHQGKLEHHLEKLSLQTQQSTEGKRFAEYRKIFAQDFGLEIHFDVFRKWYEGNRGDPNRTIVLGYITLPLVLSRIQRSKGPGVVSYLASKFIDPSVLTPVTADQRYLFEKALKALQIKPMPQKKYTAGFLHPPSFTTKEQDSYVCSHAGCLARFDTEVELRSHQFLTPSHPEFFRMSPKVSEDLDESPVADPNIHKWPKLMILSSGLLAAGALYDSDDDEE